jgi:hypothetical protein
MPLSALDYADKADNELMKTIKAQQWQLAVTMLKSQKGQDMAREKDIYDNTPLHAAIGYKAPDELILTLLQRFPEATRVHGTDYWLPLHVAAMWGTSPGVMEAIIRLYPDALDDTGEPGIKGRTPRHFSRRFAHNKEALERSTSSWIAIINNESKQPK